ncbi:hypothetical protein RHSIM_Rhsim01G0274100 [Rhododendron simsii]|uniref:Pre-mRNA-splicing factor 18 n=1 Tax=Rhododendron simsii TaxID=118357 RepID=A0A834HJ42_RHOSS|nr:hypothetical protein RHSIM_Rhsim01G0274100 [Rhododendron simsii]
MKYLCEELRQRENSPAISLGRKKNYRFSEMCQYHFPKLKCPGREESHPGLGRKKSKRKPSTNHSTKNNRCNRNNNKSQAKKKFNPEVHRLKRTNPIDLSCKKKITFLIYPVCEVREKMVRVTIGEIDASFLASDRHVGGRKVFKRSEIEQKRIQLKIFCRGFDRLKYVLKAGQKSGVMGKRQKGGEDGGEDKEEEEGGSGGEGGSSGVDYDKDLKSMKANFEDLCDEDKILVFFKKLLNEWNQELNEMGDSERRTAKGKSIVATFKQCARYLHPLFKFCRKKVLPDDIRQALLLMVECCMKRDYLAAMDHYIRLAIGNAPWPIGVTMVGIHERSAREKIHTSSVAHIMNDETTRKYLQSVKRLMTFCQRRYPTMPSKAVEFNSLANGSDLHSLLAEEEKYSGANQVQSEERLRIMPAPSDC